MEKLVVTGGAGFIGANLAEHLHSQGHSVHIIDDFSTGREQNLNWVKKTADRVQVHRQDINDTEALRKIFRGARFVFHEAAIPSVPRSIADPARTHAANITGTLSVLIAARDAGVKRVVAASSSSVYGDDNRLPKVENRIGKPLSPYALSKIAGEEYCRLFYNLYGLETVSLRYFNVFGPRQNPMSEYAAVIPKFSTRLLAGRQPIIFGDGEQSRDFTFVANIVDANWKAATCATVAGEVFNIGCGAQTNLNQLVRRMNRILGTQIEPLFQPARAGDVRHSLADIGKAKRLMGYAPEISLDEGLKRVLDWYRVHEDAALAVL